MPTPSIRTKQRNLVALRQFALTSPGGRMSLIEAGRLLQTVIPADNTATLWLDKKCNTIDAHHLLDMSLAVTQDYLENFTHSAGHDSEGNGVLSLSQVQASGRPVIHLSGLVREFNQFVRSEFYNRILKPAYLGWAVELPIRHIDDLPLAMLTIGRSFDAPDFSSEEIYLLEQAQPWLEHLARRDSVVDADTLCISSGDSATLLIDAGGKMLSASSFALSLLHHAADTSLSAGTLRKTIQGDVSELLKRLGGSIASAMNAQAALPPSLVINNRWGRFKLLAYVLTPLGSSTPLQIALHIEHHVPLSLGLFRLPRFLELTPREREVCLFSLAGLDRSQIARELGIKPSTVIYFTRQLYQRLNIYRQSELLPALMQDTLVN